MLKGTEELTAEISSNIGECHLSEAVLICKFAVSEETVKVIFKLTHGVDEFDAGEVDVLF